METCAKTFTDANVAQIRYFIDHHYTYRFYLDGMPSATILTDPHETSDKHLTRFKMYHEGVPIGYHSHDGKTVIFNHFEFTIKVRTIPGS